MSPEPSLHELTTGAVEMQDFAPLHNQLARWEKRRRWRDTLIWGPRGLLVGLLLAVLLAAAARLRPLLDNAELLRVALAVTLCGAVIALAWAQSRRRDLLAQARFADQQFQLQERASTAVEIYQGTLSIPPLLAQQQLRDTVRAGAQVNTQTQLPLRINRQDWIIIGLAFVLLGAAFWLPNPQLEVLRGQRAVTKSIAEQAESLASLLETIQENPALTKEQQAELQQPVASALEALQEGGLSQEEAVAVLSEAEADLRDLAANSDTSALQQQLQEAGAPLADNPTSQALGQALQDGNLSAASAAANQLADALPNLSAAEQSALAQDLAETAQALQNTDSQLAQQLAEAAQALQNGDVAAAQQALREAAGTLQQRAQEQIAAQQAAQAAEQLGQGRESVAQAGQSGQSQGQQASSGEGQSGQGQSGEGQNGGEGASGSPIESLGNESDTGSATAGSAESGGPGGPGPGGGHVENVYVPPVVDLGGEEGIDVELPAECLANPAACGSLLAENPTAFGDEHSIVPYSQVFGDYRDAAYEALDSDYIPLGMKEFVRDYFSSLEP